MSEPRAAGRLGVFGGTFDPLHQGHLIAAQDIFEAMALERIVFVPARRSPHKEREPAASTKSRFRMIECAVEGDDRFEVSDTELSRESPSYTIDTLEGLAAERPGSPLVLILGVDQWARFGRWRAPARIAGLAHLALMTRAGERAADSDPGLGEDTPLAFTEVPVTRIDISSSLVRSRVRRGLSIRYLVPEAVRRIIEDENLYVEVPRGD